jgi:sterol desaturase/sphingolipid hydroxylase (fatty acid hydroxylase superfamily)
MEALIRFGAFLSVFIIMIGWEFRRPRRRLTRPRQERWLPNLGLTLLNTVLVRVVVGGAAYTAAVFAADQGVGLLRWYPLPAWAAAAVTLLGLDFAVYVQHILFHAVPVLWRLHRVHHVDLDFDATTGLRFHPLEILLSLGYKAAVVVLLGAVPWAVVAFEVILNAASVFNHGNVALPERLDRWLRWGIVTPDMHRVHHSTRVVETNSNFGFAVSWWDRLCGTYRAQPMLGHVGMEIGLSAYRLPLNFGRLLLLPFRDGAGRYTYAGSRPERVRESGTV